ncbi:hypothetical protein [Streptomyces sp. S1]|uniref:hypothetical protein n=1 Tax=Streptomyces sp. S1 TaxID=718288 RepID=UPI003D765D26
MRCAHWRRVPLDLVREAREKSAVDHVDGAVQCQLSAHEGGDHFSLLSDTGPYGTALWLCWSGTSEAGLVVLPDCSVAAPSPDGEGCCLFVGHAKRHTWEGAREEVSCTS